MVITNNQLPITNNQVLLLLQPDRKDMKMKSRKKMVFKIVFIVLAIIFAASFVLPIAYSPWLPIWFCVMAHQEERMRVRLLCKTDHEVLLEACRELSKRVGRGDLKPGRYNVRRDRHPMASQFPQPILQLAPSYVYIDENDSGRVMMEMLGGLDHFGVEAYTEDYKKPYPTYQYGDKELIPGLWYYDDGYRGHPEYDKRIEALLQKRK
jgi:hypothetical protein